MPPNHISPGNLISVRSVTLGVNNLCIPPPGKNGVATLNAVLATCSAPPNLLVGGISTVEQYYGIGKEPPHKDGKISKWYGWKHRPHGRTLKLIEKMQPDVAQIKIVWYD